MWQHSCSIYYIQPHSTDGILFRLLQPVNDKDPISNISYCGGLTHTGKAIRCLHDNILTSDGFCQMNTDIDCLDIVIVTDGSSNRPLRYNESCQEMDQIKYKWHGVVNVHVIGIGMMDRKEELECLANSNDSIFSVINLSALEGLVNTC